jgi:excinuclease ABC subunit B
MALFRLTAPFAPMGDQPQAIDALSAGLLGGERRQVLLGVTGSGKTFTMAHTIARMGKPALIIAPNKTLAAQLYNEFKELFPENAVEYFVSYYDYYQPEAYIPASDTYIQKDSSINELIDKLRHSATRSVLSRQDVIVVASVSCIYGLGAPEDYLGMRISLETDAEFTRQRLLRGLVDMQYERNDVDFHRGTFRVRGDRVEIFPAYEEVRALRIDFFGDQIDGIAEIDPLRGIVLNRMAQAVLFPASHYVTAKATLHRAIETIKEELKHRVDHFRNLGKWIEAQRIEERTNFDLEMMLELGYCNGIENYSRHLTGRAPGEPPPTLLDYFPDDFILFIDESHITVPQLGAMYRGDRSRKQTLVEYGFRLPSALDNRPLMFEEFQDRITQCVYVSATPGEFELRQSRLDPVEQIVRPTGLLDPVITIRKAVNQVDDLYGEILGCIQRGARVLVTTLTKRLAEDLTDYYTDLGVRVRYLHADIGTLERMEIIRDLRKGVFDVLVGINLLREGLDIPEVSLVAILDADKEGFLRSARSLVQTFGRAARNAEGRVILYADHTTGAMDQAITETDRRRSIQADYNLAHGITPATIAKSLTTALDAFYESQSQKPTGISEAVSAYPSTDTIEADIETLEKKMQEAVKTLDFELAAGLRDRIHELKKQIVFEF